MPESQTDPQKLAAFGRSFFLLFNRFTMYDMNHPSCKQAVDIFLSTVQDILKVHSPLVFIMNQEQLFIDEEPVDPRINTTKMVTHLKKADIQSISFYEGLDKHGVMAFVEVFTALNKYPHVSAMKKELEDRGISHIKLNHFFFKKVATDEEVISRDTLELEAMPFEKTSDGQSGSKTRFMERILESVLMEDFGKALTVKNITENPAEVSNNMIAADLATYRQSDAPDKQPGLVLVHQLQMMEEAVEKHLSGIDEGEGGGDELSELAEAVFDMKRELINGIEHQKSLGVYYANEQEILDKANEITDNVLLQLIKDEYKSGQTSTKRLAQILKRLVPDVNELKRLLPKIKKALLEEGMPLSEYLNLVQELSNELQSEELSKILRESAEMVGLNGDELIQELRSNPAQAAELIFLAAEIQKGTGDENVLTDLLVDYVERLGSKLTLDTAKEDNVEGEQHLRQVMGSVESQIIARLKNMGLKKDSLAQLEEKLNSRMDELFEKLKEEWRTLPSSPPEKEGLKERGILEILEKRVGESQELGNILKMVHHQAQSQGLDENDYFKMVLEEITKQKEQEQKQKADKLKRAGVLDADRLMFYLEKEISKSLRYNLPFAAMSFSVVSATPKQKPPSGEITQQSLIEEVLQKLATEIRGSDVAALLEKNILVVLLPITPPEKAKLALQRHLKLLNGKPVDVEGVPVTVRVVGAMTNIDPDRTPNAEAFFEALSSDLSEVVNRIKEKKEIT